MDVLALTACATGAGACAATYDIRADVALRSVLLSLSLPVLGAAVVPAYRARDCSTLSAMIRNPILFELTVLTSTLAAIVLIHCVLMLSQAWGGWQRTTWLEKFILTILAVAAPFLSATVLTCTSHTSMRHLQVAGALYVVLTALFIATNKHLHADNTFHPTWYTVGGFSTMSVFATLVAYDGIVTCLGAHRWEQIRYSVAEVVGMVATTHAIVDLWMHDPRLRPQARGEPGADDAS